ncbi:MAG: TrgA family protein [Rhodobacteraceae bacterium]|nr:TrgA family protein [Paracoccaceae bacterium]
MPTAAKLVSAVLFALLGFFVADLYAQGITTGERTTWLHEGAAVVSLICGWRVMGRLVGKGNSAAVGSGLRTALTALFFTLLFFAIYEMVVISTKGRYDGPMDAVLAIFEIMLEKGRGLLTPEIIGSILVGGALGGIAAEATSRRWP